MAGQCHIRGGLQACRISSNAMATEQIYWHGHPHPLTCPEGMSRKSIAVYYCTNGRPAEEVHPKHRTLLPILPGEVVPEGVALDPETPPLKQ